jgi:hypothetical protein
MAIGSWLSRRDCRRVVADTAHRDAHLTHVNKRLDKGVEAILNPVRREAVRGVGRFSIPIGADGCHGLRANQERLVSDEAWKGAHHGHELHFCQPNGLVRLTELHAIVSDRRKHVFLCRLELGPHQPSFSGRSPLNNSNARRRQGIC